MERYLSWAWAEAALADRQPAEALATVERLLESAHNPAGEPIPILLKLKGEALAALDELPAAEAALGLALQGARDRQARPILWQIHRDLGRLAQRMRRPTEAAREFEAARGVIGELAATLETGSARQAFLTAALTQLPRPRPASPRRSAKERFGGLTEREQQVAELIARGQSNREIAAGLVLSERTVKTHVAHILSKLGLASRAQVAAWAVEHSLRAGR